MRILVLFFALTLVCISGFCEEAVQSNGIQNDLIYQDISYSDCTKIYNINKEVLLYLAIGAINANRFKIEEFQTDNGYIIFCANKNKYLATIGEIDKKNSILKITPCNNLYHFQPGIISNIHKFIDLSKENKLK